MPTVIGRRLHKVSSIGKKQLLYAEKSDCNSNRGGDMFLLGSRFVMQYMCLNLHKDYQGYVVKYWNVVRDSVDTAFPSSGKGACPNINA